MIFILQKKFNIKINYYIHLFIYSYMRKNVILLIFFLFMLNEIDFDESFIRRPKNIPTKLNSA